MTNKTISLPEDIYLALKKEKRKGESFADLISRLLKEEREKEKKLERLAGCWKDADEWDDILEQLYKDRRKPTRL
ncbi:MAG: antitoxin VapB family protein [Promethearchaeota archaeon]